MPLVAATYRVIFLSPHPPPSGESTYACTMGKMFVYVWHWQNLSLGIATEWPTPVTFMTFLLLAILPNPSLSVIDTT